MSDTHAEIAFVSKRDIPASPPPFNALGPRAWARENLFATPRDTVLTITFGLIVFYALYKLLPWLVFDSVWIADSIRDCRATNTGACFAVLTERINQLLFGFYPKELYWRPILAFVLMFVAIAPILHDNLPRKLLWFSAFFPLLAYWLLWGGSIWVIALILLALFVAVLAYQALSTVLNPTLSILIT